MSKNDEDVEMNKIRETLCTRTVIFINNQILNYANTIIL